jgi:hypothetical protein
MQWKKINTESALSNQKNGPEKAAQRDGALIFAGWSVLRTHISFHKVS